MLLECFLLITRCISHRSTGLIFNMAPSFHSAMSRLDNSFHGSRVVNGSFVRRLDTTVSVDDMAASPTPNMEWESWKIFIGVVIGLLAFLASYYAIWKINQVYQPDWKAPFRPAVTRHPVSGLPMKRNVFWGRVYAWWRRPKRRAPKKPDLETGKQSQEPQPSFFRRHWARIFGKAKATPVVEPPRVPFKSSIADIWDGPTRPEPVMPQGRRKLSSLRFAPSRPNRGKPAANDITRTAPDFQIELAPIAEAGPSQERDLGVRRVAEQEQEHYVPQAPRPVR
jgi:hypothetical protein